MIENLFWVELAHGSFHNFNIDCNFNLTIYISDNKRCIRMFEDLKNR